MTSPTGIRGIDHVAILVSDLAKAESAYRRLGFRPTPIGHHNSTGTANHCVMLDADYFEVMGIVSPTAFSRQWAEAIAEREGLWGIALMTDDLRETHARLKAAGFAPTAPAEFSRPVDVNGATSEARFTLTYLEPDAVQGVRLFVCQHHTRDLVWRPDYVGQPNGAAALAYLTLVVDDPAEAAAAYGRVFGVTPIPLSGGMAVQAGGAKIRLLSPVRAAAEFVGDPVLKHRSPVPVGLGLSVSDRRITKAALNAGGVPYLESAQGGLRVGSVHANGVILDFV